MGERKIAQILRRTLRKRMAGWMYAAIFTTLFMCVHAQDTTASWKQMPTAQAVNKGGDVTLSCEINNPGQFQINVIWSFNGKSITFNRNPFSPSTSDPRRSIVGANVETDFNLRITNLSLVDNGVYSCQVQGTDLTADAKLTVVVVPGTAVITTNNSGTSKEGDTVFFNCSSFGGNPPPTISWFRDNEPIQPSSDIQYSPAAELGGSTSSKLSWRLRRADNEKMFACRVSNQANPSTPRTANTAANVQFAPVVNFGPYNPLILREGATEQVACTVEANPQVTSVEWLIDGVSIGNTRSVRLLDPVRLTDRGQHTCIARNIIGSSNATLTLDVQYPPKIEIINIQEGNRLTVNESSRVNLTCSVRANPPATEIVWRKNGTLQVAQPALIFQTVTRNRAGMYRCTAKNTLTLSKRSPEVQESSKPAELVVQYRPGRAVINAHPEVVIGDPINLKCTVGDKGIPEAQLFWERVGSTTQYSPGEDLNIPRAALDDNGSYRCTPKNKLGRGPHGEISVGVNEIPTWLQQNSIFPARSVSVGDVGIRLACRARGKPAPNIEWLKNGVPIENNGELFTIRTEEKIIDTYSYNVTGYLEFRGTQRLTGIQVDDTANYTCLGSNHLSESRGGGKLSSSVELLVRYAPMLDRTQDKVAVDMNQTASLVCQSQAYPAVTFRWIRAGQPITADGRRSFSESSGAGLQTSTLTITRVSQGDLGNYSCIATNPVGETTVNIDLTVRRQPDAPTNLRVRENTWDSVLLEWTPGFNGGYDQTFVIVKTNSSGKEEIQVGFVMQYNITGLFPDTSYTFQVYGKNALKAGDYSQGVPVRTAALYVPPASDATFNGETGTLQFKSQYDQYCIRVEIEKKNAEGVLEWQEATPCAPPTVGDNSIKIQDSTVSSLRVALCLTSRPEVCGAFSVVNATRVLTPPPSVDTTKSDIPIEVVGIIAGVCGGVLLILVIILIVCCCRKKKAGEKGPLENENRGPRPQFDHHPPSYVSGGGFDNPAVDRSLDVVDFDDPASTGVFATHTSGMNGNVQYGSLDRNKMRPANGHVNHGNHSPDWQKPPPYTPDTSYEVQNAFNNGLDEHEMNRRNMERSGHPYYNMQNMPNKSPLIHPGMNGIQKPDGMSVRSGHESGYSTPDPNKPKKVIYEVIV
ncbi:hemicentin-1 isoform X1 [Lingula anatina]|uniref:Hemicentin-1 isoform X1 n=1 Tax=Lingula anatina TaxID=7574 RepID=A0A1S3HD72_LINAN|nr:hemicentin-1 isoform X1 [Lingula anatina]XP_013383948.1 hemicentin-1 isoform X1 [Lingula anatina]XP_013383950.1 hemicentin-1 isoform X1 [Lingula anatina]XP_013383951.1 hemicentin-1 isoform X1 [Lingula anatina]XP_013383953.1 hemicentin-1 isoform X1 [Lingula anatina]XP_013383954.1 hemicentin-1 isoform X1 [Lingula anatina]XP_013383955.1 hemicentin-1 isoform X1 [Lingula anatina]XP_013383956.1 hemicentin-1 isoform X1 [Lingula anatina]XP_013383957.1 hemicentin-1 isoform X1 [Lingula anatina]XP|eukprot:XP_013383947.1 hemicentin-1 isoform X1 [Lingula anatina]